MTTIRIRPALPAALCAALLAAGCATPDADRAPLPPLAFEQATPEAAPDEIPTNLAAAIGLRGASAPTGGAEALAAGRPLDAMIDGGSRVGAAPRDQAALTALLDTVGQTAAASPVDAMDVADHDAPTTPRLWPDADPIEPALVAPTILAAIEPSAPIQVAAPPAIPAVAPATFAMLVEQFPEPAADTLPTPLIPSPAVASPVEAAVEAELEFAPAPILQAVDPTSEPEPMKLASAEALLPAHVTVDDGKEASAPDLVPDPVEVKSPVNPAPFGAPTLEQLMAPCAYGAPTRHGFVIEATCH